MHGMGNVRVLNLPVFTMLNTKLSTPINVTYPITPLINNKLKQVYIKKSV